MFMAAIFAWPPPPGDHGAAHAARARRYIPSTNVHTAFLQVVLTSHLAHMAAGPFGSYVHWAAAAFRAAVKVASPFLLMASEAQGHCVQGLVSTATQSASAVQE